MFLRGFKEFIAWVGT